MCQGVTVARVAAMSEFVHVVAGVFVDAIASVVSTTTTTTMTTTTRCPYFHQTEMFRSYYSFELSKHIINVQSTQFRLLRAQWERLNVLRERQSPH